MQAAYEREVRQPFDAEFGKVRDLYVRAIDATIGVAQATGKRDMAIALRAERQRVLSGQVASTDVAPPAIPELVPLRTQWRTRATRLEDARTERARALHARYDAALAQAEAKATAQQQAADADAIKAKRAEISAQWLTPAMVATTTATTKPVLDQCPRRSRARPKPPRLQSPDDFRHQDGEIHRAESRVSPTTGGRARRLGCRPRGAQSNA
jgi:hypothetical protein